MPLIGVLGYAVNSTPTINIPMATKKPRVVGYIDPDNHDELQQFMKQYDCTESKAIALILHSYFSGTSVSTPTSRVNEASSSTSSVLLDNTLVERLETLENKLEALSSAHDNTLYDGLQQRLGVLENKEKALSGTA